MLAEYICLISLQCILNFPFHVYIINLNGALYCIHTWLIAFGYFIACCRGKGKKPKALLQNCKAKLNVNACSREVMKILHINLEVPLFITDM